jgi:lysophospholipase L1-like esterase
MISIKHTISIIAIITGFHISGYGQNVPDSTQIKAAEAEKAEDYKLHNDWPNLDYYHDDNKKLTPHKKNRVVLIGDSITELWEETDPVFFRSNDYLIDRGISGQTTPQILLRLRQDAIALKPRVVVVLAGTNDIAGNTGPATIDQIFGNLVSMIQLAQANHIKVVICSVLPVFEYPWATDIKPAGKIIALNRKLKVYALSHHITYLDYYTSVKDNRGGFKSVLTRDGVHPNLAGYKVMEPLLLKAIKD